MISNFIALLLLPLVSVRGADVNDPFNVPSCGGLTDGQTNQPIPGDVRCHGYMQIPTNFDVGKISSTVEVLMLYSGHQEKSAVLPNFVPLPRFPRWIHFNTVFFNEKPGEMRFPLRQFLINNLHVRNITLQDTKLLFLTKADLAGMNSLTRLSLAGCGIRTISTDSFDSLGALPSGAIQPVQLRELRVTEFVGYKLGFLESLDRAFLKPVSQTLESLSINDIPVPKLIRSTPFLLSKTKTIKLSFNDGGTIPELIYTTFNATIRPQINLETTPPLCANQIGCGCCAVKDFGRWVKDNGMTSSLKSLRCGPNDAIGYITNGAEFERSNLFEDCDAPVEEDKPFTATCAKGLTTKSEYDIDAVVATQADFDGDRNRKCVDTAYTLHKWILDKAGLGVRRSITAGGVQATCTGKGVISVNELDPDTVTSSKVSVKVESTKRCLDFFFEYVGVLMAL